jgi:hypothetical protein
VKTVLANCDDAVAGVFRGCVLSRQWPIIPDAYCPLVVDGAFFATNRGEDANIRFSELRALLSRLGFAERIKGSHHIFTRDGVAEILNLQSLFSTRSFSIGVMKTRRLSRKCRSWLAARPMVSRGRRPLPTLKL